MSETQKLGRYPYYVLAVLFAGTALNYYDRNVIAIILQPMKASLHLTDMQAGLLSGLAFAVVYSLLGIPVARFADRGRRVAVLGTALAVWSIMTAVCGFTTGFASMFLARIGVGAGESGGVPTTHALVADYFPADRRAGAFSAIAVAGVIGGAMGLTLGGLAAASFGWRAAFWVGGLPGLVVSLLVFTTIREPGRHGRNEAPTTPIDQAPLGEALLILVRRKSFVFVTLGFAVAAVGGYASATWTPAFLMRSFGVSIGKVGLLYSLVSAIPGLIGMSVGGVLTQRWIKRDLNAYVWIMVLTFGLAVPFGLATYLSHSLTVVLILSAVSSLISTSYIGPMYALIQALAGPKLRATATAVIMMVSSLVALSLGPWIAGVLSDQFHARFGAESLRWSLCAMLTTSAISVVLFLLALPSLKADIAEAESA